MISGPRFDAEYRNVADGSVFVIDDEEPIRFFIQRLLLVKGFQVEMAVDGEIAFSLMNENKFDLVLCDIMIPKMNGMQLYEKIKNLKSPLAERFIFVSGCSADEILENFLKKHQVLRVTKPFVPDQLVEAVFRKLTSDGA